MKLGIIGFGNHVEKNIINVLLNIKTIKIDCFHIRSNNFGIKIAKKYNIRFFNNINDFLDQDIDITYIACPPEEHEKYIKLALKKRSHVICEKPITLSYNKNIKLYDLALKNKKFLFEVCQYKFHNHFKKIKKIIDNDMLKSKNKSFFYSSFKIPFLSKKNFRLKKTNNDTTKYEIGFYPISLINELFNDIKINKVIKYKNDINYFGCCYFKSQSLNGFIDWGIGFQYSNQISYFSKNIKLKTENLFTKKTFFEPKIEKFSNIKSDILLKNENHFENMFNEYFKIILDKNIKKYNLYKSQTLSNSKLISII